MPTSFHIDLTDNLLRLSFGEPASNDRIVREVDARMKKLKSSGSLCGGPLLRINGPASLAAMATITHHVAHLFGAVAIYDPKLERYVVCVSHSPDHPTGTLIE